MVSLRPRKNLTSNTKEPNSKAPAKSKRSSKRAKKSEVKPRSAVISNLKQPASGKIVDKSADIKDGNKLLTTFLSTVTDVTKHTDIEWLYNLARTAAPELAPELQGKSTLAFGGFDYETKSKCRGRWARLGIMVNKTGLSIMVSGEKDGKYLLETYDPKSIGKANIGKSCIRFKKLSDLNTNTIEDIFRASVNSDVSSIAV